MAQVSLRLKALLSPGWTTDDTKGLPCSAGLNEKEAEDLGFYLRPYSIILSQETESWVGQIICNNLRMVRARKRQSWV